MKIFPETLLLFFLFSVFPSLKAQPAEGMESLRWSECDTVVVSSAQIRLPAIVTTPKGEGKNFPVCVLLGGSGPTDKDGTLGPTKFLRDLAQGLAERGIASVRYDKRTAVYGARTAEVSNGRLDYDTEVCEDALAALKLMKEMFPESGEKIWIVGHSLGAMLAPRVVAQSGGQAKGLVALAAPARNLQETLRSQIDYLGSQQGMTQMQKDAYVQQLLAGLPKKYLDLDEEYKAVATAKGLSVPMLFLQGENDYQVTTGDALLWQFALTAKPNARIIILPKLNHLFAPSEKMAQPTDYVAKENKIAAEVLDIIAKFVL